MATTRRRTRPRHLMEPPPRAPSDGRDERYYAGSPRSRGSFRAEIMSWSGLNVLAGIWLIISPFVLGYTSRDATWNPILFGAIVSLLAFARFGGAFRTTLLSWINLAIGVWLFISAWWLASSVQAAWNAGILGVLVFIFSALSLTATEEAVVHREL